MEQVHVLKEEAFKEHEFARGQTHAYDCCIGTHKKNFSVFLKNLIVFFAS
jgi:hypothetical protein